MVSLLKQIWHIQTIYKKAEKSIIIVDDYLGIKTLHHLTHAEATIDITIISDNKGYNPFAIVTWQFILAIGYFLVPFLIWDASSWTPAYLSWPVLRPIIALAVLCSGVAFVIYAACVDRIGMTRTTVFLPLVAIVSAVAASLLGQDTLEPLQFVGIAVAMLGVVMAQASFKKEKDNEA